MPEGCARSIEFKLSIFVSVNGHASSMLVIEHDKPLQGGMVNQSVVGSENLSWFSSRERKLEGLFHIKLSLRRARHLKGDGVQVDDDSLDHVLRDDDAVVHRLAQVFARVVVALQAQFGEAVRRGAFLRIFGGRRRRDSL